MQPPAAVPTAPPMNVLVSIPLRRMLRCCRWQPMGGANTLQTSERPRPLVLIHVFNIMCLPMTDDILLACLSVFHLLIMTSLNPHGQYDKPHPIRQTTQINARPPAAVPTATANYVLVSLLLCRILSCCRWQPMMGGARTVLILCNRPRPLADSRI